ncbi:phage tail tape measure protein [Pseudooceanicola sp. CBS1P-1]|uniref:Phage tail tape measure protein n=1 Tax=Pseudooceanicola albus TaxID=2692189 RepID=A0A6L7FWV9_9RHOB|nr:MULTISPECIES: phage tail tape measure protein [Pseudooceanicola]MBT9383336.1 phage tail tape measure protein [Pseudooceanicola endophyticus]MXN16341.1 phage tail tape measure protein [Pseudooceanicola albus]
MVSKRIETQLTIKAVDRYSGALKQMATVTGRFAEDVRSEMGRLQQMRGPLRLIEDFRKQQAVTRESAASLDRARERVRQLKLEITTTANPTQALRREFDSARRAADRLEQKHGQNRATLRGLQSQLEQAGVKTRDLAGEQARLSAALDQGTTAFGRQMQKMERLAQAQEKIAAGRQRMERTLATSANLSFTGMASLGTGRRIATSLSNPIKQAVDFESAMADVKKVVNFDAPDGLAKMSDDILKMSGRIPMAAEGIAAIVAAGGQSGLKTEELTKFAEMAAKVGVAFDISAEKSGDAMASIKTALGLSLDDTGKVFDAINHLSNNMASTAPKVLDFMTRAGSAGQQAGFSADETLAIGSAMIAAGAEADVAATSFLNMGRALTKGNSATDRQSAAMQKLGLNTVTVAKRMQKDATGTLEDVLMRINKMPDYMRTSIISDIFGDEARALGPLVGNVDLLRQALGLVAKESNFAGSASQEYAVRAETTANNLQLMHNKVDRLGITLGEVLIPPMNDLLDRIAPIIDGLTEWTKVHPGLTRYIMAGAAATAGLAITGGLLMSAAAGLIGTLAVLRFGLVGLGARSALVAGEVGGVGRAFGLLLKLPKFALSSLITPLRWGTALLPNFAPGLARFAGFRRDATDQMTRLERSVASKSKAMQASLNSIKWGAFSAGAMAFLAMRNLPEGAEAQAEFRQQNREKMDNTFRNMPVLGWAMGKYEDAVTAVHGAPPGDGVAGDSAGALQQRARGGPFGPRPLLVGERGPELYFPNRSGFIATNRQLQGLQAAVQGIRMAGAAAVAASVAAAPVAAATRPSDGLRIEINRVNITVPSGISDPEAIVDLMETRLGDRLAATLQASFAD